MIRVVTDGMRSRGPQDMPNVTATHYHRYKEFARARLIMDDGQGDVFELYLDDNGNLELRKLQMYNAELEARVLYRSSADERQADDPRRDRATNPTVGDRTACRHCPAQIEYTGDDWRDRASNRTCWPGRDGDGKMYKRSTMHEPVSDTGR